MDTNENIREMNNRLEQEGMEVYQYIVDNCYTCQEEMPELIKRMRTVDMTGQFLASTARYLAAIDREKFRPWLDPLIQAAIERDRECKYIGALLQALWGDDYESRVEELNASDDNFRRIYKRVHREKNPM